MEGAQLQREKDLILNMYEDNGHDRKTLEKIAKEYRPKEQRHKQVPENLFSILPFHNDNENNGGDGSNNNNNNNDRKEDDGIELRPNAKIPFIPGGISYKLKRALNKAGCNVYMTAGQKLQNVLCSKRNLLLSTKSINDSIFLIFGG